MTTNLVIDADGHCYEPDTDLVKWLPKEYAHLAPNRVTDSSGYSHLMIEGRLAALGRRRRSRRRVCRSYREKPSRDDGRD